MQTWMILAAGILLPLLLWRAARLMQNGAETRRHGALMAHLDWTREASPRKPSPRRHHPSRRPLRKG